MTATLSYDVVIIGGGPAGLTGGTMLARQGLSVLVLEKQAEATLADPALDGRDIALTHYSKEILEDLGVWQAFGATEVSAIRSAQVENGTSPFVLQFEAPPTADAALGYLISNHRVRKAAYDVAKSTAGLTLRTEVEVEKITTDSECATVTLVGGEQLSAKLAIAADSRFSAMRRKMGIPAEMHDFGRTIIVFQMDHDQPHHSVAHECFYYGYTLAVLPLHGNRSSVVITVPASETDRFMAMEKSALEQEIAQHFNYRLGGMKLVGERYAYPLVAVYASRFTANRFALMGDAAVGMHPVTAHGFNFGLRGAKTLTKAIAEALAHGGDIASPSVLQTYQRKHFRNTRPLYLTTNAIVKLYTNETAPAKLARNALIFAANKVSPAKKFITAKLSESGARPSLLPKFLRRAG